MGGEHGGDGRAGVADEGQDPPLALCVDQLRWAFECLSMRAVALDRRSAPANLRCSIFKTPK